MIHILLIQNDQGELIETTSCKLNEKVWFKAKKKTIGPLVPITRKAVNYLQTEPDFDLDMDDESIVYFSDNLPSGKLTESTLKIKGSKQIVNITANKSIIETNAAIYDSTFDFCKINHTEADCEIKNSSLDFVNSINAKFTDSSVKGGNFETSTVTNSYIWQNPDSLIASSKLLNMRIDDRSVTLDDPSGSQTSAIYNSTLNNCCLEYDAQASYTINSSQFKDAIFFNGAVASNSFSKGPILYDRIVLNNAKIEVDQYTAFNLANGHKLKSYEISNEQVTNVYVKQGVHFKSATPVKRLFKLKNGHYNLTNGDNMFSDYLEIQKMFKEDAINLMKMPGEK